MATNYPNSIDDNTTLPDVVDAVSPISASDINDVKDAVVAVENELGIMPSGTYGTVRDRMDYLDGYLSSKAPTDATYLTLNYNVSLSNHRRLVLPSNQLISIDGGAGSTFQVGLSSTAVTPGSYTHSAITVDGYGRITSASSGYEYWVSAGSDIIAQNLSSQVGIGTNAPNSKLDVAGALNLRGTIGPGLSPAGQGRIYFDSGTNTFKVSENGGSYIDLVNTSALTGGGVANKVAFWTGGLNVSYDTNFTYDNTTEYLGIGTSTPNSSLVVEKNQTTGTIIQVTNSTNSALASASVWAHNGSGNGVFLAYRPSGNIEDGGAYSNAGLIKTDSALSGGLHLYSSNATAPITLVTAGTEKVRITYTGNVGIGITSPAQKLHLIGNARIGDATEVNPDHYVFGHRRIAIGGKDDVLIISDSDSIAGPAVSNIMFGSGTSSSTDTDSFSTTLPTGRPRLEYMRIQGSNGFVGIGNTSPSQRLDVSGSFRLGASSSNETLFADGKLGIGARGKIIIASDVYDTASSTGEDIIFGSGSASSAASSSYATYFSTDAPRLEYARIHGSNGYVGIGTSVAAAKTHISNSTSVSSGTSGLIVSGAMLTAGTDIRGSAFEFDVSGNSGGVITGMISELSGAYTGADATIVFSAKNNLSVGIGTVNYLSDLAGTFVGNIGIRAESTGDPGAGTSIGIYGGSHGRLEGNVGVVGHGWDAQSGGFSVGVAGISDGAYSSVGLFAALGNSNSSLPNASSAVFARTNSASVPLIIGQHNFTDVFEVSGEGHIGIGAPSNTSDLIYGVGYTPSIHIKHTAGYSSTEGSILNLSSNDGSAMTLSNLIGEIRWNSSYDSSGNSAIGSAIKSFAPANWTSASDHRADLRFYTAYTSDVNPVERMRITSDGIIRINNTTNAARLVVKSSTTEDIFSCLEGSGSTAFVVKESTYVGINTATPSFRFEVADSVLGSNDNLISIALKNNNLASNSSTYVGNIYFTGYAGTYLGGTITHRAMIRSMFDGTGGGADMQLWTSPANSAAALRVRIDPSGNVGIGTASPTAKLHVWGDIDLESTLNTSASGTEASPVITMASDVDTGLFHPTANAVAISAGGSEKARFASDITFSTNGFERVRITSAAGDVGIGTASPGVRLHVDGAVAVTRDDENVNVLSYSITVGNRSFIAFNVTSGVASAISLTTGTQGQVLVLYCSGLTSGTATILSGTANMKINGTWTPNVYDTLTLIYTGSDWAEISRSANA